MAYLDRAVSWVQGGKSVALISGNLALTHFLWKDQLLQEACPVPDVVVEVVLGQIEHVLAQQLGLFGIGYAQLSRKVHCL